MRVTPKHTSAALRSTRPELDRSRLLDSSRTMRLFSGIGLLSLAMLSSACGAAQGPRVRVATASQAELQSVEDEDNVWYEFQPGDIVPVQFGFIGAVEGGSDGPAALRAKQQFFLVTSKHGPLRLSFDGETLVGGGSMQAIIAPVARKDGKGGALLWMLYMGESGDAEAELDKILAESE